MIKKCTQVCYFTVLKICVLNIRKQFSHREGSKDEEKEEGNEAREEGQQ